MKNLLRTPSVSWAESVRIALAAEGIESAVLDQNSFGVHGMLVEVRVAVIDDDQLPRAQAVLAKLQPPTAGPPPSWRWPKRGLQLLGLGIVLLLVSTGLLDREDPLPAIYAYAGFGVTALTLLIGFLFIALGPRADKGQPQ